MVVRFKLHLIQDSRTHVKEPYDFHLKQLQYQSAPCFIDWFQFFDFVVPNFFNFVVCFLNLLDQLVKNLLSVFLFYYFVTIKIPF